MNPGGGVRPHCGKSSRASGRMTLTFSSLRRIVVQRHSAASNSKTSFNSGQHWLTTGSPMPKCTNPPNRSTQAPSFSASNGHDDELPPPPALWLLPVPGTRGVLGGGQLWPPVAMTSVLGMVVVTPIIIIKRKPTAFAIFSQIRCVFFLLE